VVAHTVLTDKLAAQAAEQVLTMARIKLVAQHLHLEKATLAVITQLAELDLMVAAVAHLPLVQRVQAVQVVMAAQDQIVQLLVQQ
jgi:predicted aconitase with swiveling domain